MSNAGTIGVLGPHGSALVQRHRAWLALLPPLVALAVQWALWSLIQPYVWFLFYPAVFASSWIGGRAAGLRATALSVLVVWWLFVPPQYALDKGSLAPLFPVLVFIGMGIVFSYTHERMRRGDQRLRDLFDQAGEGIFVADLEGRYVDVNQAGCRMLGRQRHELVGRTIIDLIPPEDVPRLAKSKEMLLGGAAAVEEWTLRHKDGSWVPVELTAKILPTGQWQAFVRDITERRRAEEALKLAATVYDSTQEGIIVTDARSRILAVNRAFTTITGYTAEEVLGRDPSLQRSGRHDKAFFEQMWVALAASGQWRGELWNRRKNGEVYPAWLHISAVRDAEGTVTRYVATFSDITPLKDAQAQLQHLAHHDTLTGLPNRLLFIDSLAASLARADRHHQRVALLFIDLDRFKLINDSLGHAAGDELLREIGTRLRDAVRAEDTVARLGGDEFTVVVEEVGPVDAVAAVARKIIEALSAPVHLAGREVAVSASVGVALYPDDAGSVDHLCKAADAAMYRAKDSGRGTFDFYTADITERVQEQLLLENALRRAIERDELTLVYQPQFRTSDRALVGVEALLRWTHPQLGEISPERFIPLAEQSQLINEIGAWVVRRACAQARAWLDQGLAPMRIAINASGRQVQHDHLVEAVDQAIRGQQLQDSGTHIELELTESVLRSPEPIATVLRRLRALGVCVAIDDFGTGYSSLAMLKHQPIDTLKIDRTFVRNLPDDANSRAIVAAVISMAHALGLKVIAEGVETEAQLGFLGESGCDEVQGFVLGRPESAQCVAARMARRATPATH